MTLKEKLETLYGGLIKKHGLSYEGEDLIPDIYELTHNPDSTIKVIFDDECMTYFLAGYVPSNVYDEMENGLKNLGYEITDSDGSVMYLNKVEKEKE